MKELLVFAKKELLAQFRTGKVLILALVFLLFGIMNPLTAWITPRLLEVLSESSESLGMSLTVESVSALDSWMQFYKNIPVFMIVFVVIQGRIFTSEYRSGTLILSLTRGLARYKVVAAKFTVLFLLWTVLLLFSFGVTYACNVVLWDHSIAQNLLFSLFCWWVFGVWILTLTVLFSTLSKGSTWVLLGTGGVVLLSTLLGMLPRIDAFMPTYLTYGSSLIYGAVEPRDCLYALLVTAGTAILCLAVSIPLFNKKQL